MHALVEKILINPDIEADIVLGPQGQRAIFAETLIERGRFGTGPDAAAQFGAGLVDRIGGCRPPCRKPVGIGIIDAAAERQAQPLAEWQLMHHIGRLRALAGIPRHIADGRAARQSLIGRKRRLGLACHPENQQAIGTELEIVLQFDPVTIPAIIERIGAIRQIIRVKIADSARMSVGPVGKDFGGGAQPAIQQIKRRLAPDLRGVVAGAVERIIARRQIIMIVVQHRDHAEIEAQILLRLPADPRRKTGFLGGVMFERCRQIAGDARNIVAITGKAVIGETAGRNGIIDIARAAADRTGETARPVRAAFHRQAGFGIALALAGDDIDHATHRLGAVKRRLRAAQNLDPLDIIGRHRAEIELAAGRCRITDADAVDHHHRMARFGPAQPQSRKPCGSAILGDGDTRHRTHDIGQRLRAPFLDFVGTDDRDRRTRAADFHFGTKRRHDNLFAGQYRCFGMKIRGSGTNGCQTQHRERTGHKGSVPFGHVHSFLQPSRRRC